MFIGIVYLVYACVYIGLCLCRTGERDKVCLIGEREWRACVERQEVYLVSVYNTRV